MVIREQLWSRSSNKRRQWIIEFYCCNYRKLNITGVINIEERSIHLLNRCGIGSPFIPVHNSSIERIRCVNERLLKLLGAGLRHDGPWL